MLLRAGGMSLLVALAALAAVVIVGLAQGAPDDRDPGFAALGAHAAWLVPLSLCPAFLLTAGFRMRGREKQIAAIWRLLEKNVELSVPSLLANSDFERRDLDRAVRFLNNRGLAHYVWNRSSDTILDARFQETVWHAEKCDACGAAIAIDVSVAAREIPRCPHCHDAVVMESLEERRRELFDELRVEEPDARERAARAGTSDAFSIAIFLLLLFTFWPAALVYAWLKWQGRL